MARGLMPLRHGTRVTAHCLRVTAWIYPVSHIMYLALHVFDVLRIVYDDHKVEIAFPLGNLIYVAVPRKV